VPATKVALDYEKPPVGELVDGQPAIRLFLKGPLDEDWLRLLEDAATLNRLEIKAQVEDEREDRTCDICLTVLIGGLNPQEASEQLNKVVQLVSDVNRHHGQRRDDRETAEMIAKNVASDWWESWRRQHPAPPGPPSRSIPPAPHAPTSVQGAPARQDRPRQRNAH